MQDLNPITKIDGLFDSYEDEQIVPAKEYNANIRVLKTAVEHNGEVAKSQKKALDSLVVDKIPEGGVTEEHIADGAVTLAKLDPQTKAQMLLSPDSLSSYFGDFLIQHHKSKPDMQGTFMNGTIRSINELLSKQMTYTRTVTHGAYDVRDRDSDDLLVVPLNVPNLAAPETYTIKTNGTKVFYFKYTWHTRYVLDEAYDINPATDTFTASWTHVYHPTYSSIAGEGALTAYFKDASGNVIFQTKHTDAYDYDNSLTAFGYQVLTLNLKNATSAVLKGVKEIIIDTACSYLPPRYRCDPSDEEFTPSFSLNFRFSNGTSERCLHNESVPSMNNGTYAVLAAYVKPSVTTDFNAYPLNIAPYCMGQCPHQPAPGLPELVLGYIDRTEDSKYSVELINSSTKQYFIRHEFQAPAIISARIKSDKPEDVCPEFISGEYYSWPVDPTDNSYISYAKVNDVIATISNLLEGYIEDITVTDYTFGSTQLTVQFNTTVNNVTVESMSVVQYPGFTKPAIEVAGSTFNLRRLS